MSVRIAERWFERRRADDPAALPVTVAHGGDKANFGHRRLAEIVGGFPRNQGRL
jgi:hypothetical protein